MAEIDPAEQKSVGRVALVTGGGSGIGRAVTLALHAAGYSVAVAGRHLAPLEETLALAGSGGARMVAAAADVCRPDSVAALFLRVRQEFGRLDLLFNNAGVNAPPMPIEEVSYEQWRTVIDANLTGAFLCAQQAILMMKTQQPRGGRIINNGSISAQVPRPHAAPYNAAKHAITGLTKSIALDCRNYGIACGQIDIGNAATDMSEGLAVAALQANGEYAAEPRIDVKHVADAVLYMAGLPLNANVPFLVVMATKMPFIGRG